MCSKNIIYPFTSFKGSGEPSLMMMVLIPRRVIGLLG